MSQRMIGRIFLAAALTAVLSAPLPAQAETAHRHPASSSAWQQMTGLWKAFLFPGLHLPRPAGTKQGPMIDPNGDPGTATCTATGCDPTAPVPNNG